MPKRQTKNQLEDRAAAGDQCLEMIKETLQQLGIEMDACPPMFYPEAIKNLFTWTIRAAKACQAQHNHVDPAAIVQCVREWIENHQQDGKEREHGNP